VNTDTYNTSYNPSPATLRLEQAAISLRGCNNCTVSDLNIDKFLYGILSLQTGNTVVINNNNITNCGNPSVNVPNPYNVGGQIILRVLWLLQHYLNR